MRLTTVAVIFVLYSLPADAGGPGFLFGHRHSSLSQTSVRKKECALLLN